MTADSLPYKRNWITRFKRHWLGGDRRRLFFHYGSVQECPGRKCSALRLSIRMNSDWHQGGRLGPLGVSVIEWIRSTRTTVSTSFKLVVSVRRDWGPILGFGWSRYTEKYKMNFSGRFDRGWKVRRGRKNLFRPKSEATLGCLTHTHIHTKGGNELEWIGLPCQLWLQAKKL